jgi:hypothetical protein
MRLVTTSSTEAGKRYKQPRPDVKVTAAAAVTTVATPAFASASCCTAFTDLYRRWRSEQQ